MSEILRPVLPAQSFPAYNATGNTGDKLDLSLLDENADGAALYCRGLNLRVTGTITQAVGNDTTINLSQLLQSVLLDIPGVATIVNSVSGNKLARLFRIRNQGEVPPYSMTSNPWNVVTTLANGTNDIDMTWPIEFSDVNGRRFDDCAIPNALLKRAKLKVTFPDVSALKIAGTGITATNLTLTVTPVQFRKRERKLGPIPVIDSIDIGQATEPQISAFDGKLTHFLVQPQGDAKFANGTDYDTLGVGFGTYKQTEDATDVDVFYDQFNRYATNDLTKHTTSQADPTSSIPFVFPPGGKQGQHTTFEAIPAGYKPRIKVNAAAATNGYAIVYRKLLDQRSPEATAARRLLGMVSVKPMTASKKPSQDPEVNAYVPVKSV